MKDMKRTIRTEIDAMKRIDEFIDSIDDLDQQFKERLKEENNVIVATRILGLLSQNFMPHDVEETETERLAQTCARMLDIFVKQGFSREEALQLVSKVITPPEVNISKATYL